MDAALDVGSNSVRLLLQPETGFGYKSMCTTRLAEGLQERGFLSAESIERTLAALREFKEQALRQGVQKLTAVATSAVRDAGNGQALVDLCYGQTGIKLNIISGDQEARLSFCGAVQEPGRILVIDIGGGSTELALGRNSVLEKTISLPIGAVRLKDAYADISRQESCLKLQAEIRQQLQALPNWDYPATWIGVGGTLTTLGAVQQKLQVYSAQAIQDLSLSLTEIREILQTLYELNLAQRQQVPGLQPERADIILYGIEIIVALMQKQGQTDIRISDRDILEGIIARMKAGDTELICTRLAD